MRTHQTGSWYSQRANKWPSEGVLRSNNHHVIQWRYMNSNSTFHTSCGSVAIHTLQQYISDQSNTAMQAPRLYTNQLKIMYTVECQPNYLIISERRPNSLLRGSLTNTYYTKRRPSPTQNTVLPDSTEVQVQPLAHQTGAVTLGTLNEPTSDPQKVS